MAGGYVKIHRSLWSSPHFKDEPFTEREAWVWMIGEAAWKDTSTRGRDGIIELKRGQFTHAIRFMAEKWGWHRNKVDRFLKRLEIETVIGTTNVCGQTVITICNYCQYHEDEEVSNIVCGTTIGTTPGQHRDNTGTEKEETKKFKKDNNPPVVPPRVDRPKRVSKRGSRLSDHLGTNGTVPETPDEYRLAADEIRPGIWQREWPRFYDHWLSAPGQRGVKLDWLATWRNWCRKACEFEPATGPPATVSDFDVERKLREMGFD